jgi:chloramphenicol-sensitive protein RarD
VAFGSWGLLVPVFFKSIAHVAPSEVLVHRIIWSVLLLALFLTVGRRWGDLARCFRSRLILFALVGSTLLVAVNWFVYIYGVSTSQMVQTSLGYFINPLVSVLLGMLFLRERLRPWQWVAIVLAVAGVLNLTLAAGTLPWIALTLAISFGFYGLLRKVVPVDGLIGVSVETFLLLVPAGCYLEYLVRTGQASLGTVDTRTDVMLVLTGAVTAIPLVCFGQAARRLPLSTLGFLQYFSPTGQFLLAIWAFHEPFTSAQLASFICIWIALAIYTLDSVRAYHRRWSSVSLQRAEPEEVSIPRTRPADRYLACDGGVFRKSEQ